MKIILEFSLIVILLGIAVWMIDNDKPHWGWFVFIACCVGGSSASSKNKKTTDAK